MKKIIAAIKEKLMSFCPKAFWQALLITIILVPIVLGLVIGATFLLTWLIY